MNKEQISEEFEIPIQSLEDIELIFAEYIVEPYEGEAHIVFKRNNKLYEVHACHCSCYGLENQWEPEEATKESLMKTFPDDFKKFSHLL